MSEHDLVAEVEALKARLAEAEDTLRALRSGEVDALVVGDRLYLLEGVEAASNRFRGEVMSQIDDAVIAIDNDWRVTYFNAAAERQYGTPASEALGLPLDRIYGYRWLDPADEARAFEALDTTGSWRGPNIHILPGGREIHVWCPEGVRNSRAMKLVNRVAPGATFRNWNTVTRLAEMAGE